MTVTPHRCAVSVCWILREPPQESCCLSVESVKLANYDITLVAAQSGLIGCPDFAVLLINRSGSVVGSVTLRNSYIINALCLNARLQVIYGAGTLVI
jgi:hypothetical protein